MPSTEDQAEELRWLAHQDEAPPSLESQRLETAKLRSAPARTRELLRWGLVAFAGRGVVP